MGKNRRGTAFLLLWIAMLIFAAANSILAKLGQVGAHHLIHGRNPISFCNVLFTANIIAGLTLLAIHHKDWNKAALAKIRIREWGDMLVIAILSGVIAPTLFFLGLQLTEVINVVLIATLDIPLTLLFGMWLLHERHTLGTWIGALLALIGILLTFFLHQPPQMPMEMKMTMINIGKGPVAHFLATLPRAGEILIAIATLFTVFSVQYNRRALAGVPVGIYSVFRMIVGAILFFIIVIIMLGWVHFIDIFSPFLWEWMALYGIIVLAGGLYLWYKGIQSSTSSDLAITTSFSPLAGIIFAYLILAEIPEYGQIIGGIVIFIGIAVALIDKYRRERPTKISRHARPKAFTGL